MLIDPSFHLDIASQRQRELIASADRHRLARTAPHVDAPQLRRVAKEATVGAQRISRTRFRELAYRASDGLEVALLWNELDDRLEVTVSDSRSGDRFVIDAKGDQALDVFYHPFAHAR
jgi:hypothetical protein